MHKSHDVSSVGLYILDILGRYMEAMPTAGGVDFIDEVRLVVAGAGGGTAIDCARLGLETRAVGAVGDDEKADFVLSTLQRQGVDVTAMARLPDVATSTSMLPITPDGQRQAWFVRGASWQFVPDQTAVDQAVGARIVHLGGLGMLDAMNGQPAQMLLQQARQAGCITTLDLLLPGADIKVDLEMLMPYVDFFMPSIEEAQALTGLEKPDDIAAHYLEYGATCCVLTMGGKGSFIAHQDGRQHYIPAMPEVQVVDTSGCGDAYSAGFMAALLQDEQDLVFCGCLATAAASLVATGLGSDAGIQSWEDTRQKAQMLYGRIA